MEIFVIVVLFLLWAVLGSFGWVLIERWRDEYTWENLKAITFGRSYCPWCAKTCKPKRLTSRQLIPIFGWLMQRWKCYRCKLSIPAWYLWIEILFGILMVVWVWFALDGGPLTLEQMHATPWFLGIFTVLVVVHIRSILILMISDIEYQELNRYGYVCALVLPVITLVMSGFVPEAGMQPIIHAVGWAVILTALFTWLYKWAKRYATKKFGEPAEWIGEWDVWFAPIVGFWAVLLAPLLWIERVQITILYFLLASVFGILIWVVQRVCKSDDAIPFIPAMVLAWVVVLVYSQELLQLLN